MPPPKDTILIDLPPILHRFLIPIHQSVTSDNAAVQGITHDLAVVSAVALHGIDIRAVRADHDAHMVGVAAVVIAIGNPPLLLSS